MTGKPFHETEEYKGHILFKKIVVDDCPENPLKAMDSVGVIHSFSNKHASFKHPDDLPECPDKVFLSYYEHGLCRWSVEGEIHSGNCHHWAWDGVERAGAWLPDKYLLELAEQSGLKPGSKERAKKMKEWASCACELYTAWCNGEVYGINVYAYPVRKSKNGETYDQLDDYRHEDAVYEDDCYGYYGNSAAEEALKESVEAAKKTIRNLEGNKKCATN